MLQLFILGFLTGVASAVVIFRVLRRNIKATKEAYYDKGFKDGIQSVQ